MIVVKLYSREACHLCHDVQAELEDLQEQYPHKLEIVDIDSSENLKDKYGSEVPVVEIGPYTLKAPISRSELQITLGAAQDRQRHIDMIAQSALDRSAVLGDTWTRADGLSYGIAKHYMAVISIFVALYLGLAFLAPVLKQAGAEVPANMIYRAYGFVCHQLAFRSFFLFGEQFVYPRAAAGVDDLRTFNQATGLSEGSSPQEITDAQLYRGEDGVGYKVALCERDVAIYAGILLFGLIFSLSGWRIPALPWYLWLPLAFIPIGLDGFSQLLSQPPLGLLPFRESTPMLRVLTGGAFGFFTAWFGFPTVEESMVETRKIMAAKWQRISGMAAKDS